MRYAILGSEGQLGSCFKKIANKSNHNFIFFNKKNFNLTNTSNHLELLKKYEIDIFINCAAYTNVEKAEDDEKTAHTINHYSLINLCELLSSLNIKLLHFSTDYIFDGEKISGYTENDMPNPKNIYGLSKLDGEKAISSSDCKYLIIRTSSVYSEFGNNFLKTMLRLSNKKELKVINDQISCPTYALDLANAALELSENEKAFSGIYNFSGDQPISWSTFARDIFLTAKSIGVIKSSPKILEVSHLNYKTKAKRPKHSVLSNKKISSLGINIPAYKKSLLKSLENYNRHNNV